MKRVLLLLIIAIISFFVLTGCGIVTSTQAKNSDTTIDSQDVDTTLVDNDSDAVGLDSDTSTHLSSTANTIRKLYINTPETVQAMEAFKNVLQNKSEFFSSDENKYFSLNNFNCYYQSSEDFSITRFTIVDMDGDKIPEAVLEISDPNTCPFYFEVLHYEDGKVYGYNFVYRAMESLKNDGVFIYSGGAADNGFAKLEFDKYTYREDVLAYSKPSGYNKDGTTIESYLINNKPVSEDLWNAFWDEHKKKEDVVWYELSNRNIEIQLSVN